MVMNPRTRPQGVQILYWAALARWHLETILLGIGQDSGQHYLDHGTYRWNTHKCLSRSWEGRQTMHPELGKAKTCTDISLEALAFMEITWSKKGYGTRQLKSTLLKYIYIVSPANSLNSSLRLIDNCNNSCIHFLGLSDREQLSKSPLTFSNWTNRLRPFCASLNANSYNTDGSDDVLPSISCHVVQRYFWKALCNVAQLHATQGFMLRKQNRFPSGKIALAASISCNSRLYLAQTQQIPLG